MSNNTLSKKVLSAFIATAFFFNSFSPVLAQAITSPSNLISYQPPVLRYLSINSANPYNYFNFLLDKGSVVSAGELNTEAKKLINYFFLGLTLSPGNFWVNLKPGEADNISTDELSRTDMGKILLEQDLELKKDVARYLHPDNPIGKKFWEGLYTEIGKDTAKKAQITTSQRVWIVPESATVVETEDGAFISEAKLKVLAENEYLVNNLTDPIQIASEKLLKQIVLPELSFDVNYKPKYAKLRQIYYSLVLAEYFKRQHLANTSEVAGGLLGGGSGKGQSSDPYISLINQNKTAGLESALPWSKDKIWQEYNTSYQKGEYNLRRDLLGLARMYFSGGVDFTGLSGSPMGSTNVGLGGGNVLNIIKKINPYGDIEIKTAKKDNFKSVISEKNGSNNPVDVKVGISGVEGTELKVAASPLKMVDITEDVINGKINLKIGDMLLFSNGEFCNQVVNSKANDKSAPGDYKLDTRDDYTGWKNKGDFIREIEKDKLIVMRLLKEPWELSRKDFIKVFEKAENIIFHEMSLLDSAEDLSVAEGVDWLQQTRKLAKLKLKESEKSEFLPFNPKGMELERWLGDTKMPITGTAKKDYLVQTIFNALRQAMLELPKTSGSPMVVRKSTKFSNLEVVVIPKETAGSFHIQVVEDGTRTDIFDEVVDLIPVKYSAEDIANAIRKEINDRVNPGSVSYNKNSVQVVNRATANAINSLKTSSPMADKGNSVNSEFDAIYKKFFDVAFDYKAKLAEIDTTDNFRSFSGGIFGTTMEAIDGIVAEIKERADDPASFDLIVKLAGILKELSNLPREIKIDVMGFDQHSNGYDLPASRTIETQPAREKAALALITLQSIINRKPENSAGSLRHAPFKVERLPVAFDTVVEDYFTRAVNEKQKISIAEAAELLAEVASVYDMERGGAFLTHDQAAEGDIPEKIAAVFGEQVKKDIKTILAFFDRHLFNGDMGREDADQIVSVLIGTGIGGQRNVSGMLSQLIKLFKGRDIYFYSAFGAPFKEKMKEVLEKMNYVHSDVSLGEERLALLENRKEMVKFFLRAASKSGTTPETMVGFQEQIREAVRVFSKFVYGNETGKNFSDNLLEKFYANDKALLVSGETVNGLSQEEKMMLAIVLDRTIIATGEYKEQQETEGGRARVGGSSFDYFAKAMGKTLANEFKRLGIEGISKVRVYDAFGGRTNTLGPDAFINIAMALYDGKTDVLTQVADAIRPLAEQYRNFSNKQSFGKQLAAFAMQKRVRSLYVGLPTGIESGVVDSLQQLVGESIDVGALVGHPAGMKAIVHPTRRLTNKSHYRKDEAGSRLYLLVTDEFADEATRKAEKEIVQEAEANGHYVVRMNIGDHSPESVVKFFYEMMYFIEWYGNFTAVEILANLDRDQGIINYMAGVDRKEIQNIDFSNVKEAREILKLLYVKSLAKKDYSEITNSREKFLKELTQVVMHLNPWYQPGVEWGKNTAEEVAKKKYVVGNKYRKIYDPLKGKEVAVPVRSEEYRISDNLAEEEGLKKNKGAYVAHGKAYETKKGLYESTIINIEGVPDIAKGKYPLHYVVDRLKTISEMRVEQKKLYDKSEDGKYLLGARRTAYDILDGNIERLMVNLISDAAQVDESNDQAAKQLARAAYEAHQRGQSVNLSLYAGRQRFEDNGLLDFINMLPMVDLAQHATDKQHTDADGDIAGLKSAFQILTLVREKQVERLKTDGMVPANFDDLTNQEILSIFHQAYGEVYKDRGIDFIDLRLDGEMDEDVVKLFILFAKANQYYLALNEKDKTSASPALGKEAMDVLDKIVSFVRKVLERGDKVWLSSRGTVITEFQSGFELDELKQTASVEIDKLVSLTPGRNWALNFEGDLTLEEIQNKILDAANKTSGSQVGEEEVSSSPMELLSFDVLSDMKTIVGFAANFYKDNAHPDDLFLYKGDKNDLAATRAGIIAQQIASRVLSDGNFIRREAEGENVFLFIEGGLIYKQQIYDLLESEIQKVAQKIKPLILQHMINTVEMPTKEHISLKVGEIIIWGGISWKQLSLAKEIAKEAGLSLREHININSKGRSCLIAKGSNKEAIVNQLKQELGKESFKTSASPMSILLERESPWNEWLERPIVMSDLNQDMFRDYDYRSTGSAFKPEIAFRLGLVWAEMALKKADIAGITDNRKVVLARDARKIEPEVVDALSAALRFKGLDVIYTASEGPNAVTSYSWAVQEHKPLMSIFITASHISRPKSEVVRGFKVAMLDKKDGALQSMSTRQIKKESKKIVIDLIKHPEKIKDIEVSKKGKFVPVNIDENCIRMNVLVGKIASQEGSLYDLAREMETSSQPIDVLNSWDKKIGVNKPLFGIKVVVDGCHTPSGILAAETFKRLGAEVILLNGDIWEIDGEHSADPSKEKNLEALQKTIEKEGAHFGISFDLDGDRGAIVVPWSLHTSPEMRFVSLSPDNTMGVILPYLIEKNGYDVAKTGKKIGVIRDVLGTFGVNDIAEKLGVEMFQTDAGYVFLKALRQKLLEEGFVIPVYGERSGHCWLDFTGEIENPVAVAVLFSVMVAKEKFSEAKTSLRNPFLDTYHEKSVPYFQSPRFQPPFHPVFLDKLSKDSRNITGWSFNSDKPTANPPQAIIALGKDVAIRLLSDEFIVGKTYKTPAGELKVKAFNTYQDSEEDGGFFRFADMVFSLDGRFAGRFVFRASSNDPTFVCSYEAPRVIEEEFELSAKRMFSVGGLVLSWLEKNQIALISKDKIAAELALSIEQANKKSRDLNLEGPEKDIQIFSAYAIVEGYLNKAESKAVLGDLGLDYAKGGVLMLKSITEDAALPDNLKQELQNSIKKIETNMSSSPVGQFIDDEDSLGQEPQVISASPIVHKEIVDESTKTVTTEQIGIDGVKKVEIARNNKVYDVYSGFEQSKPGEERIFYTSQDGRYRFKFKNESDRQESKYTLELQTLSSRASWRSEGYCMFTAKGAKDTEKYRVYYKSLRDVPDSGFQLLLKNKEAVLDVLKSTEVLIDKNNQDEVVFEIKVPRKAAEDFKKRNLLETSIDNKRFTFKFVKELSVSSPMVSAEVSDDLIHNSQLITSNSSGGIDLSEIKLSLHKYSAISEEKRIAAIGEIKTLLCVDALLDKEWASLAHLYYQEIVLLVKYGIVSEIKDRDKLLAAASMLKDKGYLADSESLKFFNLLSSGRPLVEMRGMIR